MNAPERILKTINHEEPDKVPAWESAFTNNTIAKFYKMKPGKGDYGISLISSINNVPAISITRAPRKGAKEKPHRPATKPMGAEKDAMDLYVELKGGTHKSRQSLCQNNQFCNWQGCQMVSIRETDWTKSNTYKSFVY